MSNKVYTYKEKDKTIYTTKFKGLSTDKEIIDIKELIKTHKEVIKQTIGAIKGVYRVRVRGEKEEIYEYSAAHKRRIISEKETKPWIISLKNP